MKELREYVINHCQRMFPSKGEVNMEFFDVNFKGELSKDELETLVRNNVEGEFGTNVNLFDGNEHSYTKLGAWIGDQGLALMLMALGYHLKLWSLMTPSIMLPELDAETKARMAGAGMITIVHKPQ